MTTRTRPWSVILWSVGLGVLAVSSALAGFALTIVSACCGSPDPPDDAYAFVGLVVAGAFGVAGVGLWSGAMTRRALLGWALALPVVCFVAAFSSVDFQSLVPVTVVGWLAFWWFLRRPLVAGWVRGSGG